MKRAGWLWRNLVQRDRVERDLDDELRATFELLVDERVASGMERAEAERMARLALTNPEAIKERVRDARTGAFVETLWRDLRYGCRLIVRSPGFALVVIATLALVIGANATVFSVVHATLWRALPYPHAERLVFVDADARGARGTGLSDVERLGLRDEPQLFDGFAALVWVHAHVTVDGNMEQVHAASATDDALALLGAWPLLHGRLLEAARDHGEDGYVRSVVISHDLWQRRLGGDPNAVGRHIEVNNLDVEVVGILRPDFRVFVPANTVLPESPGIWFPRALEDDGRSRNHGTIARLAPGVTLADVQARLGVLAERFQADRAVDYRDGPLTLQVRPLQDAVMAEARPALWAVAGAVAFVLLIGCVNVGNLMLARASVRTPEMAVRQALGAGRARLVFQLLTETGVLVVLGGASGLLVAWGGVAVLEWIGPAHIPRLSQIAVDRTVIAFTAALAIGVSLVLSLLPAMVRPAETGGTLAVGRANVQRPGVHRLQRALVVAEVALSIVPLVAGGLMLHTVVNLMRAPIGFDPEGLLTAKVPYSLRTFDTREKRLQLKKDAVERVARLPGVRAARRPVHQDLRSGH